MIGKVSVVLVTVTLGLAVAHHARPRLEEPLEMPLVSSPAQDGEAFSENREERLREAVMAFYQAEEAQGRTAAIRRPAFVDSSQSLGGEPVRVDEMQLLDQAHAQLSLVRVTLASGEVHSLLVEELPSGRFLVDSETATPEVAARRWEAFLEARPTEPRYVRVHASLSDYYNYQFQSYEYLAIQLEVDGRPVIGYLARNTVDANHVQEALQGRIHVPMIVALRFPESVHARNQVVIDHWLQTGWVITDDASAPASLAIE